MIEHQAGSHKTGNVTTHSINRREWIRRLGIGSVAAAIAGGLPSLAFGGGGTGRRPVQRLIVMFSPNGVVPESFWPEQAGDLATLPEILQPLDEFRSRTLVLHGVDNRVRGDGDDHMRGMSCLLTGIELSPGNIQGGGNTPSGWPRGLSIDQEIANGYQSNAETRCRFGSLEFGVLVPDRADVWTRMVYTGANRPVAPISDPKQMFRKLFGAMEDRESLASVLDVVSADFQAIRSSISAEDRHLLDDQLEWIHQTGQRVQVEKESEQIVPPEIDTGCELNDAHMPEISACQQDLLVAAMRMNMTRIATLQYTNAVGNARMNFLGIEEGHHELSHDPDEKKESVEKLVRINRWYCEQLAGLARRLDSTPEPGGEGTMLDHTTIIWTNELGKGNSHTLSNIPMVLVGGGLGWRQQECLKFKHLSHNRLWISLAQSMGHSITTFGNPKLSRGGNVEELYA